MFYGKRFMDFNWSAEAYTCARMDFDNFLFSIVKENTSIDVFENTGLTHISVENNEVSITGKTNKIILLRTILPLVCMT